MARNQKRPANSPVREFLAERIAALLIGLVLGLAIAIGAMVYVGDLHQWWILVVIPAVCGLLCALAGDRAIEALKDLASRVS